MYLCFQKQNLVVADFQLVYDTDNFIQLDFYAEGLKKEPLLYDRPIFANKTSYGFLKGTYEEYKSNQDVFLQKIQNQEWVDKTSKEMIQSILYVHKLTKRIEKSLEEKQYSLSLWVDYFESIAKMLSYKGFSNHCEPVHFSADRGVFEEEIKNVNIPSHVLLFYRKVEELKNELNGSREIQKFIHRYGFLYDFHIASTPFENEQELRKLLENTKETFKINKSKKHYVKSFDIQLYKRMAWYEEMRHYYQARALRNYRVIFERLEMDIFKTGIDDFHKRLREEDRTECC